MGRLDRRPLHITDGFGSFPLTDLVSSSPPKHKMGVQHLIGAASLFAGVSLAGFSAEPKDTTVLDSRFNDGVQISYKEVIQHASHLVARLTNQHDRRPTSVRPPMVFVVIRAMSIYHPVVSTTLVSGLRTTQSTHSSGSLRREKTLKMLLWPSG